MIAGVWLQISETVYLVAFEKPPRTLWTSTLFSFPTFLHLCLSCKHYNNNSNFYVYAL